MDKQGLEIVKSKLERIREGYFQNNFPGTSEFEIEAYIVLAIRKINQKIRQIEDQEKNLTLF